MVLRSALTDWINGNMSQLDRYDLIDIASYFEEWANHGLDMAQEKIEEDNITDYY